MGFNVDKEIRIPSIDRLTGSNPSEFVKRGSAGCKTLARFDMNGNNKLSWFEVDAYERTFGATPSSRRAKAEIKADQERSTVGKVLTRMGNWLSKRPSGSSSNGDLDGRPSPTWMWY